LQGRSGAAIVMDARTGALLAMASSPTFDARSLDESWAGLVEDSQSPLVNRATQGLYQPGTLVQTYLLAEALTDGLVTLESAVAGATDPLSINGTSVRCLQVPSETTVAGAYASGCPALAAELGTELGAGGIRRALERWHLTRAPAVDGLLTDGPEWRDDEFLDSHSIKLEAVGQGDLTVSPLQVSLAVAALANGGEMPQVHVVDRVEESPGIWRRLEPNVATRAVASQGSTREVLQLWETDGSLIFRTDVAIAGHQRMMHTWFSGILGVRDAPPLVCVVLLEHTAATRDAYEIGRHLLGLLAD